MEKCCRLVGERTTTDEAAKHHNRVHKCFKNKEMNKKMLMLICVGLLGLCSEATCKVGPRAEMEIYDGLLYSSLSNHVTACGDIVKDNGKCLAAFEAVWTKAISAYQEKIFAYSSNKQRIERDVAERASNEKEIRQNEERIEALEKITREEFEERADFESRQSEAKRIIERLNARNVELRKGNERLVDSVRTRDRMKKPKVELTFAWQFKAIMSMGNEDLEIGLYDIDQKVFPCRFSQAYQPVCDQLGDFSVKRSLKFERTDFKIGPFKSAAEAKTFKQDFVSGKKKIHLNVGFSISVTNEVEHVLIEPSKKEFTWNEFGWWCVAGAKIGYALAAVAAGESIQGMDMSMPARPTSKYSEPIYKGVDTFYVDCCFKLLDSPDIILQQGACATSDTHVCKKSKKEIETSFRNHLTKSSLKILIAKIFAVMNDRPCDGWSVKKILNCNISNDKLREVEIELDYEIDVSQTQISAVVTINRIKDIRFAPGANRLIYDMQDDCWKARNASEFFEGVRKSLMAKIPTCNKTHVM